MKRPKSDAAITLSLSPKLARIHAKGWLAVICATLVALAFLAGSNFAANFHQLGHEHVRPAETLRVDAPLPRSGVRVAFN
jgi:hypothetical protein